MQCSDGCTDTTRDVEASIRKTINAIEGSCKFYEVHACDESNGARFEFVAIDGRKVPGLVTAYIVVRTDELTAFFSLIELDGTSI